MSAADYSANTVSDATFENEVDLEDLPVNISQLPLNTVEHIFSSFLGPKDLARARTVCSHWNQAATGAPWEQFFKTLWPQEAARLSEDKPSAPWDSAFNSRMRLARSLRGKPEQDRLWGHSSGVKAAMLFPSAPEILLTGSVDRTLRVWDLSNGIQLAQSRPHAGTVRCLAADDTLLATASSDHRIRVWFPASSDNNNNNDNDNSTPTGTFPFSVGGERRVLGPDGHTGPVDALQLTEASLISGSWDYTVRVWDRTANLTCVQCLHFEDWVQSMAQAAGRILVAAGSDACVLDAGTGSLRAIHTEKHTGPARLTAIEGSPDGRTLFYGTGDGSIHACDLRCSSSSSSSRSSSSRKVLVPPTSTIPATPSSYSSQQHLVAVECASAVTGLSFDFPWLAASLQDGEVLLLNAERALGYGMHAALPSFHSSTYSYSTSHGGSESSRKKAWPAKVLAGGAGVSGGAQCVQIRGGSQVVAGYEGGAVVCWDFSKAHKADQVADAMRAARRNARKNRKLRAAERSEKRGGAQQQQ